MGAVKEEDGRITWKEMAVSVSALYLALPKVRTVAQKHSCRGLGRGKSGRVICRADVLYHFSKIYKSLARWN